MNNNNKLKICILVDSLSNGGAEKAAAELSNTFYDIYKEIVVISLKGDIVYQYSGNLFNLGTNESRIRPFKQLKKIFSLRKIIRANKPDYIIDFRVRSRAIVEVAMQFIVFSSQKIIYTVHSYNLDWYFPKLKMLIDSYKQANIVAVSESIKNKIQLDFGFSNVSCIPNAINFDEVSKMSCQREINDKYIIAVGRLVNEVKQHNKLIKAYNNTSLKEKGIKLYILGDGEDKNELKKLISKLGLQDAVILLGYVSNPYPYMKKAIFNVLSSKIEGLPMVIIESFILGVPVVSFNCKSGPSEMVVHNENGLLIEDQDFKQLEKAMDLLSRDKVLLDELRKGTQRYLNKYSPENNLKLWNNLLK